MFALIGSRVPVGLLRFGFRTPLAGRFRRRIRVGRAVEIGLLFAIGGGLLSVRVAGVRGVRDLRGRAGPVPAALLILLLLSGVLLMALIGVLLLVRPLLLVGVLRVALFVVDLVLLLRLTVVGLLAMAPVAVLLWLLRLFRIVLRLAAVGGLLPRLGLLPFPSDVPEQRVLRMPRFGAWAPAILSHRSPRAARRRSRRLRLRLPSRLLLCHGCSNTITSRGTLPYRDQMTTSTPSPGALPDTRSDSRACCRMMTAAA